MTARRHSSIGPEGGVDLTVGEANTHVIAHAGRIFALVEDSFPHVLTPELETVGTSDFGGRLTTAMTAHPKTDPVTGELHVFGYSVTAPYVTYHKHTAAGELVTSAPISVPGPTMMHDFAITDRHAVFLDLPLTFTPERALESPLPFDWDDNYGARIGIMALDRPGQVRWFEVDPGYLFQVGNAHTDGAGRVVLDATEVGATPVATVTLPRRSPPASTAPGSPMTNSKPPRNELVVSEGAGKKVRAWLMGVLGTRRSSELTRNERRLIAQTYSASRGGCLSAVRTHRAATR